MTLTLGVLTAIRAIVACSPAPGRDRLLAQLDAAIDRARAEQPQEGETHE